MPRNSGGSYSLPNNQPQSGSSLASAPILANLNDIASALTQSVAANGVTTPSANLPMGGYKHTGVANGVADTEYAAYGQVRVIDELLNGVKNRAYAEYTANVDITAIIPSDNTIPQITEGTQILTASITPTSATSRIRCRFQGNGALSAGATAIAAAMFQDSTANAFAATIGLSTGAGNSGVALILDREIAPATTSAVTISVRVGPTSAVTARMNGTTTGTVFGSGIQACTLILEEVPV